MNAARVFPVVTWFVVALGGCVVGCRAPSRTGTGVPTTSEAVAASRGPGWIPVGDGAAWTGPVRVAPGEAHEYPEIVVDGQGAPWLAWIDHTSGVEQVRLRRLDDSETPSSRTLPVTETRRVRGWPALAPAFRGVWVAWAEREQGLFRVRVARADGDRVGPSVIVSRPGFPAFRPRIVVDGRAVPWVVWEERRGKRFAIVARRMTDPLGPVITVDDTGELNLRPAAACSPRGDVVLAWDHYEAGAYDIRMRRLHPIGRGRRWTLTPVKWVTHDPLIDQAPSIAFGPRGQCWIAWHSNRGSVAEGPPRSGRGLVLATVGAEGLHYPAAGLPPLPSALPGRPEMEDCVEFPALQVDSAGRPLLFARRGQGFLLIWLDGAEWHGPFPLSRPGWGGRGRNLQVATAKDGTFLLAARWLHLLGTARLRVPARPWTPPVLDLDTHRLETVPPGTATSSPVPAESASASPESSRRRPLAESGTRWGRRSFFGDLHTHSWMSDGTGDPDEVFTRSRDHLGQDFVALTDHDVVNGNPLAPCEWAYVQEMANLFLRPGRFVTLLGYEWTSPPVDKGGYGHRNLYFPGDQAPLFSSGTDARDTVALFARIRGRGAVAIPHHTSWTGTDWDTFDPERQPLFEIVSVHGCSERPGSAPIAPRLGNAPTFAVTGLSRGLRFGFVGGSDGHGVPWHYGVSRQEDVWTTGATGIYAESLTRTALIRAMKQRRTYATSGPPIRLWVEVNGTPMGEVVRGAGPWKIAGRVDGTAPIVAAVVVVDGHEHLSLDVPPGARTLDIACEIAPSGATHDVMVPEHAGTYLYLRVVQQDGAMAWSSPVWLETEAAPADVSQDTPSSRPLE